MEKGGQPIPDIARSGGTVDGVSCVMAAYNAEETVSEAVESLLSQDCPVDLEVIVVDDGSTDGTIVKLEHIRDPRLRVVPLASNVGRAKARNIGVSVARYTIIVVADADDVSLPGRVEEHLKHFSVETIQVSSGQVLDLGATGDVKASEFTFPVDSAALDSAFRKGVMGVAHPAAAYRKGWFDETGAYDVALKWCEDFDLMLRGWTPGSFAATDRPLILYRRRTPTTNWSYWWQNDRHHQAILRRHSDPTSRTTEIGVLIEKCSSPFAKLASSMRFLRYRVLLQARSAIRKG